ncbi:hypothetical protein SAMD00019534_104030 [Acytostelium subglobosum LB1]|uniref:hypothetical protein n=1 Tax=Acytostelium subglobosum LB1 TaxID=1410327 RepID=UPI0006450F80|nr:hypothetical protein SAMD00019534_104030 [Acytostelium subglobosum LB1]GAM27228.1 hypothetical protein SAMD00019534_104030 [Acytostelium subglobosum LB1]|eukprot:XP_012749695.1 hypothetical protein SAMD00019534_104030 [Acytostelium subglobosum LB1]
MLSVHDNAVNADNSFFYKSHYYTIYNQSTDLASAKSICSQDGSYLVTITNDGELKEIIARAMSYNISGNILVDGSDFYNAGVWIYTGGPEINQTMYQAKVDMCSTVCPWDVQSYQPTTFDKVPTGSATVLSLVVSGINSYSYSYFSQASTVKGTAFVCEGGKNPTIAPISTDGGLLIINGLDPMATPPPLTFYPVGNSQPGVICNASLLIANTTLICMLGPNAGTYDVLIGGSMNVNVTYTARAPYLSSIQSINSTHVVIVGNNFGANPNEVSLILNANTGHDITCTVSISGKNTIICAASNIPSIIFPIKITVSGITYMTSKTAIRYGNVNNYFRYIPNVSFDTAMNVLSTMQVDIMPGFMTYINSSSMATFATKYFGAQYLWEPLTYTGGQFTSMAGSSNNMIVYDVYTQKNTLPSSGSFSNLYINMSDNSLAANPASDLQVGAFIQFLQYDQPVVSNVPVLPVAGGQRTIKLNGVSVINLATINWKGDYLFYIADWFANAFIISFPAGYNDGASNKLKLSIGLFTTIEIGMRYEYPVISDVSNLYPPTQGTVLTLSGSGFYKDNSVTKVTSGVCSAWRVLDSGTLECTLVPGTGSIVVGLTVGTSKTSYTWSYSRPSIDLVTSIALVGGNVILYGNNFGTNPSQIVVSIGGALCGQVKVIKDHTMLSCVAPPGVVAGPVDIYVNVSSQSSNLFTTRYSSSYISSAYNNGTTLSIFGNQLSSTTSRFNLGQTIMPCVDVSSSFIQCNLTTSSISDFLSQVLISDSSVVSTYQFYLSPFIASTSYSAPLPTRFAVITLTGYYFESKVYSAKEFVQLSLGIGRTVSMALDPTAIKSSTSIVANITLAGGADQTLQLTASPSPIRYSNLYHSISFKTPVIGAVNAIDPYAAPYLVTITGSQIGPLQDTGVAVQGVGSGPVQATFVNDTTVIFPLPETAKLGTLKLVVTGQESTPVQYTPVPSIGSITQPHVLGGQVTITGRFMATNNANGTASIAEPSFTLNGTSPMSCARITSIAPYLFICPVAAGSGPLTANFTYNSTSSTQLYRFSYQRPSIISTTTVKYMVGGNITIRGDNYADVGLQAAIGGRPCNQTYFVDYMTIICLFDGLAEPNPKGESLNVTVTVNTLQSTRYLFLYYTPKPCVDDCSGRGDCNLDTGICHCYVPYGGFDCKSSNTTVPVLPPTVNPDGGSVVHGSKFNFSINLAFIREMDSKGEQVVAYGLSMIEWVNHTELATNKVYMAGVYPGVGIGVEVTTTIFETASNVSFGNELLPVAANSIKYEVSITNWTFASPLNMMQVVFAARAPLTDSNECTDSATSSAMGGIDGQSNSTINWFQIKNGESMLQAHFSQRVITDDRVVRSQVLVLDPSDQLYRYLPGDGSNFDLLTAIIVPPFTERASVDPNFGSLVSSTVRPECAAARPWLLPVIITASIVGGCLLVGLSIFIIRKYFVSVRIVQYKLRNLKESGHRNHLAD